MLGLCTAPSKRRDMEGSGTHTVPNSVKNQKRKLKKKKGKTLSSFKLQRAAAV